MNNGTYELRLRVSAVKATADQEIVNDCGVLRVRAGEWVVDGDCYGPTTFTDAEMAELLPISEGTDTRLQKAIETGKF
jgi:hypothetical protein